jgi:ferredoxin
MVNRSAFDRIIQAGGYVSVNTGNAVDGNAIPIEKDKADHSFAAAACIGCGACVAACKNASAMLFVSAKVSHLALLPQGEPERKQRVVSMIAQMDKEGFGSCTNTYACEAECPKEISVLNIARLGSPLKGVVSFHGNLVGVPANKAKLTANVLVCHGNADPFVPQAEVDLFKKQMDSIGATYTFKGYDSAMHAFTSPGATEMGKKFGIPVAYNAAADSASWNDMKVFFGTIFK